MTMSLLITKLCIPPVRPERVSRPRLIERLNAGLLGRGSNFARRLTLVSAPAGFGKTTLVTEWLSGIGLPRTWLSLEEGDNDPVRFFAYLVAALQGIDRDIGQAAQAMSQAPQPPPPEALLTSLINDLATVPHVFILVLDDYHLIHTLPIHQMLTFLLEHQPPKLHLVIASREDPPLPLARLRARGQMADVRQADLRFTTDEAADFLRRVMGLELPPADVATLHRRTEGWIAGLQLAALALQGPLTLQGSVPSQGRADAHRIVQSFTGSHRYVLDYLIEEVFRQQPAGVQDFLLKTSILDRFTAPLCDAVLEIGERQPKVASGPHAEDLQICRFADLDFADWSTQQVLEYLECNNLFVVPLDESRQWYRYHHLFAGLLRHRLELEMEDVAPLHRRACRWYADHSYPADAIRHALAASDWEEAASLIASVSGDMLSRGEVVTLLGWYRALPDAVVLADPKLCLEASWPLILSDQIDTAESYLAHVEHVALENEIPSLMGAIAVARAHIARLRGDDARVIELSERALSLLPEDDLSSRSVVAVNLGIVQWFCGRLGEAERALLEARRAGRGSRNAYARWAASAFLGRMQAARGRLHQAAASGRRIIQQGGQSPVVAVAHFDLGRLLYEWNELEAAADHLQRGIELARRGGSAEFEAGGSASLAFVKQAKGDPSAAQAALQKADQLVEHPGVSPPTRLYILASHAVVALGQGDLDTASLIVEQFPTLEEAGSFPDYLYSMLIRARLLLAQGRRAVAAAQLEALHEMASRAGWQSTVTRTRALQAVVAPTHDEALTFLAEALALAEPEGYVRAFVDAGEPMAALLRQVAASQGIGADYARRLLAAFSGPGLPSGLKPETVQPETLVEPLSGRELDVLHSLAEGHTNQEIAQSLCVSVNTVKTHLKNIYGKLGVGNRRQATAKAEELGLIS